MYDALADLLAEGGAQVLYLLGAGALTALGLAAEYESYLEATSGHTVLTVWFAVVGAVVLYAGLYQLGYQKVLGNDGTGA